MYALSLLAFSAVSVVGLYLLQRLQGVLPLNPTDVGGVPSALAFNTAASFVTNTNWQNYAGESTMSHLTQMAGLTVQNFVSAAVGIAVAVALVRGPDAAALGDDRQLLGRPDARHGARPAAGRARDRAAAREPGCRAEPARPAPRRGPCEGTTQSIYRAPIASQEAIKELGTNGGGIANANSAHPFENPTAFTNLVENWALLAIPFALAFAFGRLVGDRRQGWALFAAMFVLWIASAGLAMGFELDGNPRIDASAPNMEGKEVRFGAAASGLFAASTTGTSTGAVIASHDSFTPLGGAVPLVNMMLGEVSPGGVGAGLYGMLIFALLAVFIAGLMVGRTPEYLGKKIQAAEMKLVVLYLLVVPTLILAFASVSVLLDDGEGLDPEPRRARPLRGGVRVHVGGEQQRLRLRRAEREHRLVQHDARAGDARRPLPADRARARDRRLARTQAAGAAHGRDVPDRDAALRRAARRRRPDHGRADLLPGARARADPGAPRACDAAQRAALALRPRDPRVAPRATACASSTRGGWPANPVMFVVEVGSVLVTALADRRPERCSPG